MNTYWPGKFDDVQSKMFYLKMKEYVLALCEEIITGKETNSKKIEDRLLIFSNPILFAGQQSAERLFIKAFEDACFYISSQGLQAKQMTVFEFYNAVVKHGRKSNKSKRPVRR